MKISAVSLNYARPKNFKGHFETRTVNNMSGFLYNQRVYVPDKNESPESIAVAWKNETGKLPHEWVKTNNIYASSYDKEHAPAYKIKDNAYMPIDVLKASILVAGKAKTYLDSQDKLDTLISLAKLEKQTGNEKAVKGLEKEMIKTIPNIYGAKYLEIAKMSLNDYKEDFGTEYVGMYNYQPKKFNEMLENITDESENLK